MLAEVVVSLFNLGKVFCPFSLFTSVSNALMWIYDLYLPNGNIRTATRTRLGSSDDRISCRTPCWACLKMEDGGMISSVSKRREREEAAESPGECQAWACLEEGRDRDREKIGFLGKELQLPAMTRCRRRSTRVAVQNFAVVPPSNEIKAR